MLSNYLKSSFKYLRRHKAYALINLVGMALGLCVCFFALQYLQFELSYDRFHQNANRIFRLVSDVKSEGITQYLSSSEPMAAGISGEFPEIETSTRVFLDYFLVQKNENLFGEEKVAYVDSTFFDVFSFPIVSGSTIGALEAPFDFILSESASRKYFGKENPIGQTLLVNGKIPCRVRAVMKDMPLNAHFRVDFLFSMSTLLKGFNPSLQGSWNFFGYYTYFLLKNPGDYRNLETKLSNFVSHHADQLHGDVKLSLEPLTKIYLHFLPRGSRTGSAESGNLSYLYIFSIVSFLILLISCFNFVNLATVLSTERTKEIGVRKVIGASKNMLFAQFLVDSIILAILAFFLAILLNVLFQPLFSDLLGKEISVGNSRSLINLGWFFLIALFTGLMAGIQPAFLLSSQKPAHIFRPGPEKALGRWSLRSVLVTMQYLITILSIIATVVIYSQLHFMQNQSLGFNKDHLMVIDYQFEERINSNYERIKDQLALIPGVKDISVSSSIPGRTTRKILTKIENPVGRREERHWDAYSVDFEFLKQFSIAMVSGRPFSREFMRDTAETMLVNQAAVRALGYQDPDQIIGKKCYLFGREREIVGVINDFHFHSFQEEIQPLTLTVTPGRFTFLSLTVSSDQLMNFTQVLESKWRKLLPGLPMSYFFADDAYNALYDNERRFGKLFSTLSLIAIFLSSMGLLGLSSFTAHRYKKEIGIRKILGATDISILARILIRLFKPVLVGIVLSIPIGILLMQSWLNKYPYRVDLNGWMFAAAALAGIGLTLLTVGYHVLYSSRLNPVEVIRES